MQLFQAAVMSEVRRSATAAQNGAIQEVAHDNAAVAVKSTTQPPSAKRSKQTDQQYDISMKESDAIMLFGSMQSERGLSDFESTIKRWEAAARVEITSWQENNFNVPLNVDPLDWWRKNYLHFPFIAQVACKVLSIPASAAACERVWSKAGPVPTRPAKKKKTKHVPSGFVTRTFLSFARRQRAQCPLLYGVCI
jgi:hypothetical protein